jgi:prevent-host-death family protein
MSKTITTGDLRRNSATVIHDVQAGAEYVVTNHGHEVARVVPIAADSRWTHNRERVIEVLQRSANPELAALIEEGRRADTGTDL